MSERGTGTRGRGRGGFNGACPVTNQRASSFSRVGPGGGGLRAHLRGLHLPLHLRLPLHSRTSRQQEREPWLLAAAGMLRHGIIVGSWLPDNLAQDSQVSCSKTSLPSRAVDTLHRAASSTPTEFNQPPPPPFGHLPKSRHLAQPCTPSLPRPFRPAHT